MNGRMISISYSFVQYQHCISINEITIMIKIFSKFFILIFLLNFIISNYAIWWHKNIFIIAMFDNSFVNLKYFIKFHFYWLVILIKEFLSVTC